MMVEYSIGLAGIAIIMLGVVACTAIKESSKNTKELHKTLTAVAGKSKEYATIKAVDRISEKPTVIKKEEPKKEPIDRKEDMFL